MNKKCVEECKFSKVEVKNAVGEMIGHYIRNILSAILVCVGVITILYLLFSTDRYFSSNDVIPLLRFGSVIGVAAIVVVACAFILPDKKD